MTTPKKKHAGGRPKKFTSVEELQIKLEAYFKWCDDKVYPYTIHGLCVALGCTRETLCNYEAQSKEFFDTIKAAKEKIRWFVEKELFLGKNQAAMIFWMKNNAGWKDQQEVKQEVTGKDGGPIQTDVVIRPQISREEWLKLHGMDTAAGTAASSD